MSIEEFLCKMLEIPPHELTLEVFKDLVAGVEFSDRFLNKHIRFKSDRYYWKNVLRTDAVEIIVCCWMPGQKSNIHFHKGASLNVSRVLMGTITEELYQESGQDIVLYKETDLSQGGFTTTERYQYHQLVNNSMQKSATLHFYSPSRPD